MKKHLTVVAAIIENENQEILCALRSPEMSLANLWEFPGGKVNVNENIFDALKREIKEELNCTIETAQKVFNDNTHDYDTFVINLISIKCKIIEGEPTRSEHSKVIWLKRQNLSSLQLAPADIPAVEQLINEN